MAGVMGLGREDTGKEQKAAAVAIDDGLRTHGQVREDCQGRGEDKGRCGCEDN